MIDRLSVRPSVRPSYRLSLFLSFLPSFFLSFFFLFFILFFSSRISCLNGKFGIIFSSGNPRQDREFFQVPDNEHREGFGNCFHENFGNFRDMTGKLWCLLWTHYAASTVQVQVGRFYWLFLWSGSWGRRRPLVVSRELGVPGLDRLRHLDEVSLRRRQRRGHQRRWSHRWSR